MHIALRRSELRSQCALLLWALGLWIASAATTWAGNGGTTRIPSPLSQVKHGLTLDVGSEWAAGYGYRPVHLDLRCASPPASDRAVTVTVGLSEWGNQSYVVVSHELVIPAGGKQATAVVAVPQLAYSQAINIRCFERGRQLDEMVINDPLASSNPNWAGETQPRILFVAATSPDIAEFSFLNGPPYIGYVTNTTLRQPSDAPGFIHRTVQQLYEEWIYYSVLDVVMLSLDDARELSAKRPGVWRALGQWARAGGTLCVWGAEANWAKLAEIEQLCGCPASDAEATLPTRGWTPASAEVFETKVIPAIEAAGGNAAATQPGGAAATGSRPTMPADVPFVEKKLGFGRVYALADATPFPGKAIRWQWFVESLDLQHTGWTARYGAVPLQSTEDFNTFLIADVGLPPIRTYRVLITLFVLAIGPLNYWLLRRFGRLHLFLFTVPLAALVTSVGLLSYALLSDGLASRLRARSLTQLDQRSGTASYMARLSYYVGVAPSRGLTFPHRTAVVPLELVSSSYIRPARDAIWSDQQYLTRGWLGSRMPTQFITASAAPSTAALDITASADGTRRLVKNRLGTHIRQLMLRDEAGQWHHGNELAIDEQAPLEVIAAKSPTDPATKEFLKELALYAPAFPDAIAAGDTAGLGWFGRRNTRYYQQPQTFDATASSLESGFGNLRADVMAGSLAARSYVAIVDRPAEIAVGLEGLSEREGSHVIHGTW